MMKAKLISVILILIILTACVVAKMPSDGDSIQRAQPEPTLGLLYVEETVVEPGYISVYDPYPAPVPYP
jgi:hypothetical protein